MEEHLPTDTEVTHPFDETAMLYTSGASIFSMFSISWAVLTVYRHQRLSPLVKFYLFCEHGLRLLLVTIGYLWGSACILWYADVALPWLNYAFGYIAQVLSIAVCLAQLAMCLNRYLAISFGGRYYDKLYSGKWVRQAILFTILSVLPPAVTLIPGNSTYYDTFLYTFTAQQGDFAFYYMMIVQASFPLFVFSTTMLMDIIMLSKLQRQRKRITNRTTAMHTEWTLAIQMMVNHLANIINVADAVVLTTVYINDLFFLFILATVVIIVLPGMYGLNVVIFLGGRTRIRVKSVIPKSMITTIN